MSPSPRLILVAGDVSYEYILYPMTPPGSRDEQSNGIHNTPEVLDESSASSGLVIRTGKADLVAQLLSAAAPQYAVEVLGPSLQPPGLHCLSHNASAICDLSMSESDLDEDLKYNVSTSRQIGNAPVWHSPPIDKATIAPASTVVISGSGTKDLEQALDFLQRVRPRYIIHHMTRPLAQGPLWDMIRNGPMTRDGVPEPDYLAVVIDADDLRAEGIALSKSLSWEATAEDFIRNLGSNGRLDTLVTCPNLIVRFGNEGVIHHRGRDAVDPKLYYHPRRMEGERKKGDRPEMLGLASAFTAGLALGFADSKAPNCDNGIRLGISASRALANEGFRMSQHGGSPAYPIRQVMANLSLDKQHAAISIPSSRISSGERWSIMDSVTGDPAELARQIVTHGPEKALAACPVQRFAGLLSTDRSEQESLRAVVDAMHERVEAKTPQPTSIGILGSPGSGKKFTTSNIAEYVAGDRPVQRLTYNTRLLKSEDFIAACHTIRDHTASGQLTIVSFENFEAALQPGHALLNDFLVMMREGKFADRGQVHSIGAPLIFFLVNQEHGMLLGTPTPITPTASEFKDRPAVGEAALLDHLHGIVRVTGPNQISAEDKTFPVRRAIMLRQMLKQRHPHLESAKGQMRVEEGVLHALLLVPHYKHGLRSLEKIISTSRLSGKSKFDVAALPPEEQIQLYVDGRIFMGYLRSPKLQPSLREKLAQGLFETYKKRRESMCKSDAEREALESDRSMRDWDELAPELKESTRAQADDIPRKLRAMDCFMLNDTTRGPPLIPVPQFSEDELDILSEMEHERFNSERLQRQWRMGPRNSKQRTTPFLVPWRDLTQEWKDVDRVMVECVPAILEKAGWRIYRMENDVELE
ncbi:hypothetical protein KC343_g9695 [Hortaea werneckii]|uniref:Ryanodine receptor Ryr domain-containing protein n=1 Tax=Hortaea werneckii TaxID=91943 RepID=A0A3M7DCH2_HORWE|nr:hypothetical protein KC352_g16455 [Hortaea werneckii]KAI7570284.1 hypothetical protein KC317_g2594 [Hortaea werneckii]KAI7616647.1 hypothetical protein KC343_g9695 [Hortaea werneckii]RMY61767.1 hypothetical protein D0864_12885 [Hortaea werneckii]